jgi:tRNA 5-methylaminomethyl-2-thiouridine biosynthesis bifunctional protein
MPEGWAWITGATYEVPRNELELQQHHQHNLERLRQLQPRTAQALAENFEQNRVQHWVGTRCVNPKRLPCVGPLEASGLWIHAALGSRGLSLSALGAELLASRIGAEPWPLPKDLAQHLMVDG